MALTRDALQAYLDHLDATFEGLLANLGGHSLVAFSGLADATADEAGAGYRCRVEDQGLSVLERRSLVSPAEGEG